MDISKLLSNESKINDKIYFSKIINVSLYENSNILFDGVKLATNFSLVKSTYEKPEFLQFYENMQNIFLNNFSIFQNNIDIRDLYSKESDYENPLSEEDNKKLRSPSKCKNFFLNKIYKNIRFF